jgi:hypothetical protein
VLIVEWLLVPFQLTRTYDRTNVVCMYNAYNIEE